MPFVTLGLSPALAHLASERGLQRPTPVQAAAIPAVLAGRDVLALASTGSGKTAAFVLPVLHQLLTTPSPRASAARSGKPPSRPPSRPTRVLVLVPTRELATQVGQVLHDLSPVAPSVLKVAIVFGGVSINPQMMALRGGADVVVATPGRLLDLVRQNALHLDGVTTLVLDEADRLLDAGFADEFAEITALLPKRRQNLLFSATLAPAVQTLAQALLNDPVQVDLPDSPQHAPQDAAAEPAIEQHVVEVDAAQRTQLLLHLMDTGHWTQVLVFVATQHTAEMVAGKLRKARLSAESFHGDQSQGKRTQVLADFKARRVRVVVATDMASRGLHIDQLPVVVNYDLPRSATEYTHRIGRTGRAGERGLAVSFVSATTEAHFRLIEKRQGRRVPREQVGGFEPTELAPPGAASGGIKGTRKSKKDKLREAAQQAAPAPSTTD